MPVKYLFSPILICSNSKDYFEIRTGLDSSDWKSYRRRLTGVVDDEHFFIDVGGSVTLIFSSGATDLNRTLHIHVGQVQGDTKKEGLNFLSI